MSTPVISDTALSFIATGEWMPTRSDDYDADCRMGRACAEEMLTVIARTENPVLFGKVIRAMVRAGRYEGVEIGFCSRIGLILATA